MKHTLFWAFAFVLVALADVAGQTTNGLATYPPVVSEHLLARPGDGTVTKDLTYRLGKINLISTSYEIEYRPVQLIRYEQHTDASTAAATAFDGHEMYIRVVIKQSSPESTNAQYHFIGYTDKALRPIPSEGIKPAGTTRQRTIFSGGRLTIAPEDAGRGGDQ